jgi:Zn-dependent peptidase ImmA (M78 family)/RNA polymerase subunit RPABC4/transcription elongation factor Spt4
MKTYKARVKKAKNAAYQVLHENEIESLPVKVKKIAKLYPNLKIRTYSWFANSWGLSFKTVMEFAGSEDGCCYYLKKEDKYLILYNEQIATPQRIRWTIAHELGHYFLGHNKEANKDIISRSDLTEEEYKNYEDEANLFARNLLAPPEIIRILRPPDLKFVASTCDLSLKASESIFRYAKRGEKMNLIDSDSSIIKRFSSFINQFSGSKICLKCSTEVTKQDSNFCRICSNEELNRTMIKKEKTPMIYNSIQLDALHRAVVCPTCANQKPTGDHCQICGSYLVNKCTGMTVDETLTVDYSFWYDYSSRCNKLLGGDARYCSDCGSASTYLALGFLEHWRNMPNEENGQISLQAVPDDISDEDLPL